MGRKECFFSPSNAKFVSEYSKKTKLKKLIHPQSARENFPTALEEKFEHPRCKITKLGFAVFAPTDFFESLTTCASVDDNALKWVHSVLPWRFA